MNKKPAIRMAVLIAALAAGTATAWAMNEALSQPAEEVPVTDVSAHELTPREDIAPPVRPSEAKPAPIATTEKAAPQSTPQPPITVEERRLTEDERIQAQVMDALSNDERLAGKIAVEARNAEVWLSGHVMTAAQASHAGRDAGRIQGVRYVHNEISFRVGRSL